MPKISKNNIEIRTSDINKYYDVVVHYNQSNLFYSEIPHEFSEIVNHLEDKELTDLFMYKEKIKGTSPSRYRFIITAGTETECLTKVKECLSVLVPKNIKKRNVIILDCNTLNSGFLTNPPQTDFPKANLSLELIYAVETFLDNKKVYSQYRTYDAFGEQRVQRKELHFGRANITIIDDTPENRAALENIYNAFILLRKKLSEYTQSPEKLMELINSNIKLLN